jgi:hypothetical protein
MFSLNDFNSSDTDKTSQETESGETGLTQNGIISTAWEAIKAAVRFKAAKMFLFIIFTGAIFLVTGDFTKSKNVADDMSTKGANDDYFGLFGAFAKTTGFKSVVSNTHPVYDTKEVKQMELDYELKFKKPIKFSRLFAYVIYKDQDFLVMKKAARGKDRKKLKLELSTIFGTSANDFCEDNFDGFIMDDELQKAFRKNLRISKIKDELTKDNDDGKKYFRCVIDPDTIEDYLDE